MEVSLYTSRGIDDELELMSTSETNNNANKYGRRNAMSLFCKLFFFRSWYGAFLK